MRALDSGLSVIVGLLNGGGAAFLLWRTVVSVRSGTIWLRGQKMIRTEDPAWFWVYVATYLVALGVMLYGVGQAVFG